MRDHYPLFSGESPLWVAICDTPIDLGLVFPYRYHRIKIFNSLNKEQRILFELPASEIQNKWRRWIANLPLARVYYPSWFHNTFWTKFGIIKMREKRRWVPFLLEIYCVEWALAHYTYLFTCYVHLQIECVPSML